LSYSGKPKVIEHRQINRYHTILNCTGLVRKPPPGEGDRRNQETDGAAAVD
jgi:hypothetical protein